VWKIRASERDNHQLDCAVYCLALAEHLGLSILTPTEWATLAKARGMPPDDALALFAKDRRAEIEAEEARERARAESYRRALEVNAGLADPSPGRRW
jgi:hypothetical protein